MEHAWDLAERIGNHLFDKETSDMTFVVEGESLPAHRFIFISSSEYFRYIHAARLFVPIIYSDRKLV